MYEIICVQNLDFIWKDPKQEELWNIPIGNRSWTKKKGGSSRFEFVVYFFIEWNIKLHGIDGKIAIKDKYVKGLFKSNNIL